jgi:hypothetical protein
MIFKLQAYPVSILFPFFPNLIGVVVDASNFLLYLNKSFVFELLYSFSPLSGSENCISREGCSLRGPA